MLRFIPGNPTWAKSGDRFGNSSNVLWRCATASSDNGPQNRLHERRTIKGIGLYDVGAGLQIRPVANFNNIRLS